MARSFNGSNDFISLSITPSIPYTMACWFNTSSMAHIGALIGLDSTSSASNYDGLFFRGDVAGDPVDILSESAGLVQSVTRTTTGCSAGVWHHACGVFSSSASRTVYLDGGSSATNTALRTPIIDRLQVGQWRTSLHFNGSIAEAAFWTAALNADEVAALSKGVCPRLIRPQNLEIYLPLARDLIDIRGRTLTTSGTTVVPHPRIYL
jgi:hypothetical protein